MYSRSALQNTGVGLAGRSSRTCIRKPAPGGDGQMRHGKARRNANARNKAWGHAGRSTTLPVGDAHFTAGRTAKASHAKLSLVAPLIRPGGPPADAAVPTPDRRDTVFEYQTIPFKSRIVRLHTTHAIERDRSLRAPHWLQAARRRLSQYSREPGRSRQVQYGESEGLTCWRVCGTTPAV